MNFFVISRQSGESEHYSEISEAKILHDEDQLAYDTIDP